MHGDKFNEDSLSARPLMHVRKVGEEREDGLIKPLICSVVRLQGLKEVPEVNERSGVLTWYDCKNAVNVERNINFAIRRQLRHDHRKVKV